MEPVYTGFAVVYVLIVVGVLAVAVATPVYLVVESVRALRAWQRRHPPPLDRTRAAATLELREQYAAGVLSLVGLEERLEETLRARSHFELESALVDLPPRPPRVLRVAAFEAAAGVSLLLFAHGPFARVAGAALALGALAPPVRWRPFAAVFAAGVATALAPAAALALGVSAAWRFVTRS
jgi:hypothetical protein